LVQKNSIEKEKEEVGNCSKERREGVEWERGESRRETDDTL
jgi:hypothetical protein